MIAVLLVLGVAILIAALLLRSRSTPPVAGELVYSDTDKRAVTAPINSHRNRLTGKPDYVYETRAASSPIEVKKHRIGRYGPRPWDVEQLTAYDVLLEDNGATVKEGLLEYADQRFTIPYTPEGRQAVLERAERIRAERRAGTAERSHNEPWRCRACGFRTVCNQALS